MARQQGENIESAATRETVRKEKTISLFRRNLVVVSKSFRRSTEQPTNRITTMKKIGKRSHDRLEELLVEIDQTGSAVLAAHTAFQEKIEELFEPLREGVDRYNELISEYNGLLDEALGDLQRFVDGRGEKWHESETAGRYRDWIDLLERAKLDEIAEPDAPEVDEPEVADPEQIELAFEIEYFE